MIKHPQHAHVVVTSRIVGKAMIYPYSHGPEGQFYFSKNPDTGDRIPVLHSVPAYQIIVRGGSKGALEKDCSKLHCGETAHPRLRR
jgi:hypothetical protein